MLTKQEMLDLKFNPEAIQYKILNYLEEANDNKLNIVSANNPFLLALESNAVLTSNAITETISNIRSKFPSLAITKKDLFHHYTDEELDGLFSKPGDCEFLFTIPITDLVSHGYKNENGYIETMIPAKTCFKVRELNFTILNDIIIRLYNDNSVFVEYLINDNPTALKNTGILPSYVDELNGEQVIRFTALVKQVNMIRAKYTPTLANGLHTIIPLTEKNKFYHIDVFYYNNNTNNQLQKIQVKYDESYIDPLTPTAFVSIVDNTQASMSDTAIEINIPALYFKDLNLSGEITIEIYETLGNVNIPVKYIPSNEYNIKKFTEVTNKLAATISNIDFSVIAFTELSNGSDGLTFLEMRNSVINNTYGKQQLPITEQQLIHNMKLDGYTIYKGLDTLTERTFIISKELSKDGIGSNSVLKAANNVYFNTVPLLLGNLTNHPYISMYEDNFILHSNAVFKYDNGKTILLSKNDLDLLKQMTNEELVDNINKFKYMYTPYTYIISKNTNNTSVKVVDFDRPLLYSKKVLATNSEILQRSNIEMYNIIKNENGYKIYIKLRHNEESKSIINNINITMSILLPTMNYLYIESIYNNEDDIYEFEIKSDMYIDNTFKLHVTNGKATTNNNYIDLKNTLTFYIHSNDITINNSHFLEGSIPDNDDIILTKESIDVILGKPLEYLWSPITLEYTSRKFKTYDTDILKTYTKNVYEINPETGLAFTIIDGVPSYNLLHRKGEIVKDENGNNIYLHRKGDIVKDNNNQPIIDNIFGVIRSINILMLDYEFKIIENKEKTLPAYGTVYTTYNEMLLSQLETILLEHIPNKNNDLLENTKIYFRSNKTSLPIKCKIQGVLYNLPSMIKPKVTLYIKGTNTYTSEEKNKFRDTIGIVIEKYINQNIIKITELKNEILKVLNSDVIGVKINNLEPTDSEIFEVVDKSNHLTLNKVLDIDTYNKLYVRYDLELEIINNM